MDLFISYEYVYKCMHAYRTAQDCITLNSSVRVYWNETKLCTRVARGKIMTVTERFSEFNSYIQSMQHVIALGLLREAYLTKFEGLTR